MKLRIWSSLLAGLVLQCVSARAANLVNNPDFTSDINGWTGSGLSWDSSDGDPSPGSAHLITAVPGTTVDSTCIVIAAPQNIDLFVNIKVASGSLNVNALSFTDTSCMGNLNGFTGTLITAPSTWQLSSVTNVPLPNGTNSVLLQVVSSTLGSTDAHFDHVLFGPTGSAPVRLQSFDVR